MICTDECCFHTSSAVYPITFITAPTKCKLPVTSNCMWVALAMSGGGGCGEIGVSSWRRGREESRPDVIQCNAWLIHGNTVVRGKVT